MTEELREERAFLLDAIAARPELLDIAISERAELRGDRDFMLALCEKTKLQVPALRHAAKELQR